jgi:penicillin-binding protein-related factor A (putative recombinase)
MPAKPRTLKKGPPSTTGKDFEKTLADVFAAYERRGVAKIRKVDPPVRVIGGGKFRKIVFLENPWLDYAGTWTEFGGRQLIIEAKSTDDPRLEIGEKGITETQIDNLLDWHRYGAAVGIVWHHKGAVRVITSATIEHAKDYGIKSFKWRHLPAVQQGEGFILWDVLEAIRGSV